MANWETVNDLLTDLLRRGGQLAPDEAFDPNQVYVEQALRYLNRSLVAMSAGGDWLWNRANPPGVLRIVQALATNQMITVTLDATAATLAPAPPVGRGSLSGWKAVIGSRVYRIAPGHTAGAASVALDSAFDGASGTVAVQLMKDEYALPSTLDRILAITFPEWTVPLPSMSEDTFRREHPIPFLGDPQVYTLIGEQTIRVDRVPPDRSLRLELEFTTLMVMLQVGGASATIPVPPDKRYVLPDGALYHLQKDLEDDRAESNGILFGAGLQLLAGDTKAKREIPREGVVTYQEF